MNSNDYVTGSEVVWGRWHTQAFRAWRESPSITHHEFYLDLPDTSQVIRQTSNDPAWATRNPPTPAIVIGQAPTQWALVGRLRRLGRVQRHHPRHPDLLRAADGERHSSGDHDSEIHPAGRNLIWYLNLNPRPGDVTDKKGIGTPHNPSWSGQTAHRVGRLASRTYGRSFEVNRIPPPRLPTCDTGPAPSKAKAAVN